MKENAFLPEKMSEAFFFPGSVCILNLFWILFLHFYGAEKYKTNKQTRPLVLKVFGQSLKNNIVVIAWEATIMYLLSNLTHLQSV